MIQNLTDSIRQVHIFPPPATKPESPIDPEQAIQNAHRFLGFDRTPRIFVTQLTPQQEVDEEPIIRFLSHL